MARAARRPSTSATCCTPRCRRWLRDDSTSSRSLGGQACCRRCPSRRVLTCASASGVVVPADPVARVREQLDGERIHIVAWQRSAQRLHRRRAGPGRRARRSCCCLAFSHARVLLGEIDVRGIAGWRGLNTLLASALTGWRIRLEPVAATDAWRRLEAAMRARRPVSGQSWSDAATGVCASRSSACMRAVWHRWRSERPGREIDVRVTRMDADEGRIFVSDRLAASGQLGLPLLHGQAEAVARSSSTARG